jgi:hypothetical protein
MYDVWNKKEYAMRRHGYDRRRPERAYLSICANLPAQLRSYFKTLVENKEEVLLLIRERLYVTPRLMDGFATDFLFDVRPYFFFSSKYRRGVFTEFDCLVLDTLSSTHSFAKEVDKQMASSPTLASAVVKAFIDSVFIMDSDMKKSPIIFYMRSYISWRIDKDNQSLSEIELVLRHVSNVKSWEERNKEECPMRGHEGIFGPLFLSFMLNRCLTSIDREIVLWLEMSLFTQSDGDLNALLDRVKKYGLGEKWTLQVLRDRIDFIRRRLVAYFVMSARPMPCTSDLNFLPVEPLLSPFIALTNLSSLGEAKLLSETDSSHLSPVVFTQKEQIDALKDVQFFYEQKGVNTELDQDEEGPCLKIWMSLVDGHKAENPVTWIYPSSSFHDTKWDVVGNYKEAL